MMSGKISPVFFSFLLIAFASGCGGGEQPASPVADSTRSVVKDTAPLPPVQPQDNLPFGVSMKDFQGKISDGVYPKFTIPGNYALTVKLNRATDSVGSMLAGETIRLLPDSGQADTTLVRQKGHALLQCSDPVYYQDIVSFRFEALFYGRREVWATESVNFDLVTGKLIQAEDIFEGGDSTVIRLLTEKSADFDKNYHYSCLLQPGWQGADNFLIRREGIEWRIAESYYPDKGFCKEVMFFKVGWKDLEGLRRDGELTERLWKSE